MYFLIIHVTVQCTFLCKTYRYDIYIYIQLIYRYVFILLTQSSEFFKSDYVWIMIMQLIIIKKKEYVASVFTKILVLAAIFFSSMDILLTVFLLIIAWWYIIILTLIM